MHVTVDMDMLFAELEKDLRSLEAATARSLMELDTQAGTALSRWLGDWNMLEELAREVDAPDYAVS